MRAIPNHVIVQVCPPKDSAIILPNQRDTSRQMAECLIEDVGRCYKDGLTIALDLKKGDRVLVNTIYKEQIFEVDKRQYTQCLWDDLVIL